MIKVGFTSGGLIVIGFDVKKLNNKTRQKIEENTQEEELLVRVDNVHADGKVNYEKNDASKVEESNTQKGEEGSVSGIDEVVDNEKKGVKVLKPTVVLSNITESFDGIQETMSTLQEQVNNTATAAWNNLFSVVSVKNPFMKMVATSPKGFGVILKNDTFIPVRAVHDVEDAELIKHFLEGLSEESRYLRFHQPMPIVRDSTANYLARRDGHTRVALIGLSPEEPQEGEERPIVVMVEYILDGDEPEVAITVADEWQGKGLGSEMLKLLATLSIAGGHKTWRAEVLNQNFAVVKILKKVGKVKRLQTSMGSSTYRVELQTKKIFN